MKGINTLKSIVVFIILFSLIGNLCIVNAENIVLEVDMTISEESDERRLFYLNEVEENGKYHIILELNQSSNTSIIFGYDVCCSSIVSRSDININQTNSDPKFLINGTINPGDTIRIDHQITDCISDADPGIEFIFDRVQNETAYISIAIIVDDRGKDSCKQGGFDSPFSFSFPIILVPLMLFIIIIFRIIYKRFE